MAVGLREGSKICLGEVRSKQGSREKESRGLQKDPSSNLSSTIYQLTTRRLLLFSVKSNSQTYPPGLLGKTE